MTGKERIQATLAYKQPDRAPRDLWALPYVSLFRQSELEEVLRAFLSDIGCPELSPGSGDTELDRQHVLPFGSTDDVRNAVRRVRDAFDDGKGGVIAQCEWDKDNSKENIKAVFEAWNEQ
jgi:hypothetical protein